MIVACLLREVHITNAGRSANTQICYGNVIIPEPQLPYFRPVMVACSED
jgi:hypothetical protein